ncbi:MAG: hypothetical protein IKT92_03775 [Bacteroidaceae bacterium]|nr:hypothetical protein [Bacteroidaceae bacterium]
MEKKVYIAPAIELFEMESEGCLLQGSVVMLTGTDQVNADEALSNKREPNNAPWGSSPWE